MRGPQQALIFYVYIDWTFEDPPRAFYVGKGKLARVQKRERNVYWRNLANKFGQRREIIFATKEEQFAFEQEKRLVAELGTFENGESGRWGANLTAGGDGVSGIRGANLGKKFSLEWREKLASKKRGARNPNVVINYAKATEIRRLYSGGGWTHRTLACHFDVGKTVIFQVLNNITWKAEHNEVNP